MISKRAKQERTAVMAQEAAKRVRAVMQELNFKKVDDLAKHFGVSRSRASNWINGYNLPPVYYMVNLCELANLSLDWIYRGDTRLLSPTAIVRLTAIMHEENPEDPLSKPKAPAPKHPKSSRSSGSDPSAFDEAGAASVSTPRKGPAARAPQSHGRKKK